MKNHYYYYYMSCYSDYAPPGQRDMKLKLIFLKEALVKNGPWLLWVQFLSLVVLKIHVHWFSKGHWDWWVWWTDYLSLEQFTLVDWIKRVRFKVPMNTEYDDRNIRSKLERKTTETLWVEQARRQPESKGMYFYPQLQTGPV